MASHIIITPALVVDLAGDGGNIFTILATVSKWMREQGWPAQLAESMFNAAVSAPNYAAALRAVSDHSGAQFVYHGRAHSLGRH